MGEFLLLTMLRWASRHLWHRLMGIARLGLESEREDPGNHSHLSDSGYIRIQSGDAVALLDVAPIGPDYLAGHGHADTLSFELSLFGQRCIVNPGVSRYGTGAERLRQRGTAAHSTVAVDGQNSSEVWGGFRVARRARPLGLRTGKTGETVRAAVIVSVTRSFKQELVARQNFMKMVPINSAMNRHPDAIKHLLVHTGQHYDEKMSKGFFKVLGMPEPDIDLPMLMIKRP